MRAKDPGIELVAVGDVGAWDEAMLAGNAANMSLISEHFYVQEAPDLAGHVAQVPRQIKRIADAHRRYRETIPALAGKNIRIALDEWNYWYGPHLYGELGTRYFLKDALGIAAGIHEYSRQADIVFMANYAQTVNVIGAIKTTKTAAAFDTTGLVLKLYRAHFGQVPVTITGAPAPLDVAAAWRDDKSALTLAIVNPTTEPQALALQLKGASFAPTATLQKDRRDGPDGLQRARQAAGGEDRGDLKRARRRETHPAADEHLNLRAAHTIGARQKTAIRDRRVLGRGSCPRRFHVSSGDLRRPPCGHMESASATHGLRVTTQNRGRRSRG